MTQVQIVNIFRIFLFVSLAGIISSCSNTRFLTEDQVLYKGAKIKVRTDKGTRSTATQRHAVNQSLAIKPTNSVRAWVYNKWKPTKDKGFKHFVHQKFGEKPILISDLQLDLRVKAVEVSLDEVGSFDATANYVVIPNKKNPRKAKVTYDVQLKTPYKYRNLIYPRPNNTVDSLIGVSQKSSKLFTGEIYNLDDLKNERARISDNLRNAGFYYFKPEYIDIVADTIGLKHQVDITFGLKANTIEKALNIWKIENIDLHLGSQSAQPADSVRYKDITIYDPQAWVKPKRLYENILFKEGNRYSSVAQSRSIANMNALGVFSYVNLRFQETDSLRHLFDLKMQGAYVKPISAELELDGAWETSGLTGPEAVASIKHNNVFHGGEKFAVQLTGSYQWQVMGNIDQGLNSYEAGVNLSLSFPRIFAFGINTNPSGKKWYASRTTIQTGIDLLNRPKYFQMVSFNTELKYSWQTSRTVNHSFSPLKVTFTSLLHTTAAFDSAAFSNPAVALSFHDQCIPAIVYQFTFDKTYPPLGKHRLFWQGTVTSAGNLLYLMKHAFFKDSLAQRELFKKPYSQFMKFTSDLRYFYSFKDRKQIAARLYGGFAIPYGNSVVTPYTEQFYSGGANSLRAFSVREIGPGTFHPSDDDTYSYWDQTGDIKLEGNIEYRFPMGRNLYGALFIDIGNIWLYKDDPKRPGGQFRWNSFYKQLALGSGFGFRYDLDFLILRADIGVPIHTPYQQQETTKYYNTPNFWKGLTLYIAIGYPF